MNIYRFSWGRYEEKGEAWYTHRYKMDEWEVLMLLTETWARGRKALIEIETEMVLAERRKALEVKPGATWFENRFHAWEELLKLAGFVALVPSLDIRISRLVGGRGYPDSPDEDFDRRVKELLRDYEKKIELESGKKFRTST